MSKTPAGDARPALAHHWVFVLTVAALWAAAVLRSLLAFDGAQRALVLALLAVWLAVVAAGSPAPRGWRPAFAVSLVAQSLLVFVLLTQSDGSDYFAILLAVPVMRAMERWPPWAVAALIAGFAALTGLGLVIEYGSGTFPLVALYAAANVFFAAYAYAARRALEARRRSEALAADLREANRRLEASAAQAERLGAARERQHLARDLHDSVTQMLFSMTLTAQSALLLLERDPRGVEVQLDQLDELAHAARDELAALSAGPLPSAGSTGGLSRALALHCAERADRDGLTVMLEIEGVSALAFEEEQALLRIVQEALNNVVKHAGVTRAAVRLRLRRPLRLEVEDEGRGFDPGDVAGAGMGLAGMRERAGERGWRFAATSGPGAGTSIVVDEEASTAAAVVGEGADQGADE
jgi:signal transduction histidine kinase